MVCKTVVCFSLDSSLCLNKEAKVEIRKDNLEVDENILSPPLSPGSFQSCSKTVGTTDLEEEFVSNVWIQPHGLLLLKFL